MWEEEAGVFPVSSMRQRLIAFVLSLAFGLVPVAAMAATAFVQDDHTPLVSKPGVGGKVLRWVDSGVALRVVARQGEWLQVAARRLDPPVSEAWVPAARVGPVPPGADAASLPAEAADADFQLDIAGLPGIAFRARCYILDAGRGRTVVIREETPAAYQIVGDAAACWVSNIGRDGYVQAVLRDADGTVIAGSQGVWPNRAVTLRSVGPWGAAGNFNAPLQFVVFRDLPGNFVPLPPIINPRPVIGMPGGMPVPPIGNPVPPIGNPVPAMGNPVPAFGNSPVPPFRGRSTPAFGNSPVTAFGSAPVTAFKPMQ
jgi:hypothetical protein